MSAAAGRAAGKIGQAASKAGAQAGRASETASNVSTRVNEAGSQGSNHPVNKGAKRDPELYILATIMTGAFGLVGYHFGRKPTSSSSEATVSMAAGSMPWQTESQAGVGEDFKYQYHPGGDRSKPIKDAPSALNSVIVPNVTLPKKAHDQFNKYGRDDY